MIRMKIRKILYGVILLLTINACKNDDFVWGDEDFVRIVGPEVWTLGTDSMRYTFSIYPNELIETTFDVELIVQGRTANYDRLIRLQVNETKTTALSSAYDFPSEVTLKAGESKTIFPLVIRRTEEIKQKDMRLCIEINPTSELKAGVNNTSSLSILWNDKISIPTNWKDLEEFFGTYSEIKFRFIISTLGVSLFPYGEGEFTWGLMYNYKLKMTAALAEYNSEHGTMLDENNNVVSFPN